MSKPPRFTAQEYLGMASAVSTLEGMAEDEPDTYGTDASYADRALTKMWELLPEAERLIVHERTGA